MVKKKGKSKRTTLKDKYKIQRRVAETHRKRKKQSKKDIANGKVIPKTKDPGIPNSWPFKQDLLKEIQRTRERQQRLQNEQKEKRRTELKLLQQHQEQGGTAKTVAELLQRANEDQINYNATNTATTDTTSTTATTNKVNEDTKIRSDGTVAAGQASRRAYLRELKKVIDNSDVILQVLDTRDPIGSRIHTTIEEIIMSYPDKRMVLVLNKIDLVPKHIVSEWLTYLRRSHPTIAIKASSSSSSTSTSNQEKLITTTRKGKQGKTQTKQDNATSMSVPVGMDGLLQLLKNYARTGGTGGKNKTTISVGILGYPNVGKSSIINALKRSRAVGVSSRPGSTASMQEVVLDRNVRLIDSPGVVFNDDLNDTSSLLGCIDVDSKMNDPVPYVQEILNRCDHTSLLMTYNIPKFSPPNNVMMFLAMVAKSHGRVLKGGIPDKIAAARTVLRDWNNGKIPYYTPPPTDDDVAMANVELNDGKETAVIVSKMGKELNLEKFDEEVMKSLNDRDELDFVKINKGPTTAKAKASSSSAMDVDAIKYLKGENNNGDDEEDEDDESEEETSDDEEDDMEVEEGAKTTRGADLKDAEDYDFDDMQ